jgi:hypothetical protein
MWMEIGTLGVVTLIPIVVTVALFKSAGLRRAKDRETSGKVEEWITSSDLQAPK